MRIQNPPGLCSAQRAGLCTAVTILLSPCSPLKARQDFSNPLLLPGEVQGIWLELHGS